MNKPKFKYKSEHDKLGCTCPPTNLKPVDRTAYRLVFEDLNHFKNHQPVLKIDPSRINPEDNCEHQCNGYALSLFTNLTKIEKKFKRLLANKPLLSEQIGNCLAQIQITIDDGEADDPSSESHFNFHEYENTTLSFTFIKKLKLE